MNSENSEKLPEFIIVGAMKSATTTIYEQLRQLDGVFMPTLKEPNFFSDDSQFDRGLSWYRQQFEGAGSSDIIGEASTHYSKLPTYPRTLARLYELLPNVKIIYIMRDPIDRLVSQYIHEWSCSNIRADINTAIDTHPELIQYSCYTRQLMPYLKQYGAENVLPVFFERIKTAPAEELERIARFIGYQGEVSWKPNVARTNVSSERIRKNRFTNFIIKNRILTTLRRRFIPELLRNNIKSHMRMQSRPVLSGESKTKLETIFDGELQSLGRLLGIELSVKNYKAQVSHNTLNWGSKSKGKKITAESYGNQ